MFILFFILLPIIELYLFIEIGGQIGTLTTIIWVFASILIGWGLLKIYNLTVFLSYQRLVTGNLGGMQDDLFLVLAGVLLIVPGFLTDFTGILCLLPAFRNILSVVVLRKLFKSSPKNHGPKHRRRIEDEDIIEGKFKRKD